MWSIVQVERTGVRPMDRRDGSPVNRFQVNSKLTPPDSISTLGRLQKTTRIRRYAERGRSPSSLTPVPVNSIFIQPNCSDRLDRSVRPFGALRFDAQIIISEVACD